MMDTTTSREEESSLSHGFAPPRVRFSKFSQLFIIPYDVVESKWYTQEEQRHFYEACLSDIRRLGDMLRDAEPALMSECILYECMGIVNYLTPRPARRVEMRQAHSKAVLSAQRTHQGDHGMEDGEAFGDI